MVWQPQVAMPFKAALPEHAPLQVLSITLMISVLTWAFVMVTVVGLAPYVPFLAALSGPHVRMLASLAGTLMIARSPCHSGEVRL